MASENEQGASVFKLSRMQLAVYTMRTTGGLSLKAIARQLGIDQRTAGTHYHRARMKIVQALPLVLDGLRR